MIEEILLIVSDIISAAHALRGKIKTRGASHKFIRYQYALCFV